MLNASKGNCQQNQTLIGMNGKPLETTIDPSIKGSPYLNEDWCDGSLVLKSGTKVSNLKLRYNCYKDRLEYQMNTRVFYLEEHEVNSFVLINCNNKTQALLFDATFKGEKKDNEGFFLVLSNGQNGLLKSVRKVISEQAEAGFNSGSKEKSYALHERYFVVQPNQSLVEIKLNKKSVMTTLGLDKDEFNRLVKSNEINVKNEKGLIKLLSLLQSQR